GTPRVRVDSGCTGRRYLPLSEVASIRLRSVIADNGVEEIRTWFHYWALAAVAAAFRGQAGPDSVEAALFTSWEVVFSALDGVIAISISPHALVIGDAVDLKAQAFFIQVNLAVCAGGVNHGHTEIGLHTVGIRGGIG